MALLLPALLGLCGERLLPQLSASTVGGFLVLALLARVACARGHLELLLAAAGSHLLAGLAQAIAGLSPAAGLLFAFAGLSLAALGSLCCWYRFWRDAALTPHIEDVFD